MTIDTQSNFRMNGCYRKTTFSDINSLVVINQSSRNVYTSILVYLNTRTRLFLVSSLQPFFFFFFFDSFDIAIEVITRAGPQPGFSGEGEVFLRFWPRLMIQNQLLLDYRVRTINNLEEYLESNMVQDHI